MDNYLLAGAEALSEKFNDAASVYSDFHKDVYGFRPRQIAMCACDYDNAEQLAEALAYVEEQIARLHVEAEHVFAEEKRRQDESIAEFEAYVSKCIELGAADRAAAIAWICDRANVENERGTYGWERLEYVMDIPFGYIEKSFRVAA